MLVHELFLETLSESTKHVITNAVGQELKFQAFNSAEIGGKGGPGDNKVGAARQNALKSRYKSDMRIDTASDSSEVEILSLEAEIDKHSAQRASCAAKRRPRGGVEGYYSENSKLLTGLAKGKASAGAELVIENSEEVMVVGKEDVLPRNAQEHGYSKWRYRGVRAGKSKRESTLGRLSRSVASLASEASMALDSEMDQTEVRAGLSTTGGRKNSGGATDELSSMPAGTDEGDAAHLSFGPGVQRVDPCVLSQLELGAAITELLRSVQQEINSVHADRLKLLNKAGWTRASATPNRRRS